jgi:hypothetical protein
MKCLTSQNHHWLSADHDKLRAATIEHGEALRNSQLWKELHETERLKREKAEREASFRDRNVRRSEWAGQFGWWHCTAWDSPCRIFGGAGAVPHRNKRGIPTDRIFQVEDVGLVRERFRGQTGYCIIPIEVCIKACWKLCVWARLFEMDGNKNSRGEIGICSPY